MKQDDLDIVALLERSLSSIGSPSAGAFVDGASPAGSLSVDIVPGAHAGRTDGFGAGAGAESDAEAAVDPSVAAVIAVESDVRFLPRTLDALFSQSVLPGFVVVADCTPHASSAPRRAQWHGVTIWVVSVHRARSFGDAVGQALESAPVPASVTRLWLLHDDSRPVGRRCLERLLETSRNSPGASVIGAKHVGWQGEGLQDVGYLLDHAHRRASLVVDGEPDQEQYDDRQEVYGVSLAGALIARPMWIRLSGSDPWFTSYGESMDLCRRVYRAGGRVMVCPRAVVAHARARYEGERDHAGEVREDGPRSSYMRRLRAADRFMLTDVPMLTWIPRWLGRLVMALVWFVTALVAKRPFEAVCDLISPFTMLFDMPLAIGARGRSRALGSMPRGQRAALVASRRQVGQWRVRTQAFRQQGTVRLLSSLERSHLRRMLTRRILWMTVLVVAALALSAAMNRGVLRAALAGAPLYSDVLVPTAADWGQTWRAATTMYTYADGFGVAQPPAPFLLVLVALAAVTGGHVAQSITVFLLLAPALAALAFWALSGVATRSNLLRFALSTAWVACAAAVGLYQHADLPVLMVHVFLPLSIALLMKAVGMYRVDSPDVARPSVQMAALASITLVPVTASEPQLVLPFVLIFVAFLIMVRSHRTMLLLMPLPSVMALGPTLFHVLIHAREGAWRELFADVTPAGQDAVSAAPSSGSAWMLILRGLGLGSAGTSADGGRFAAGAPLGWAIVAVLALSLVLAVVCLAYPSTLRIARMMWTIVFSGVAVVALCGRVAVRAGSDGAASGSVLPGLMLVAMGVLMGIALTAGPAADRFDMLSGHARSAGLGRSGVAARAARVILSVCVVAGSVVVALPRTLAWQEGYRVAVVSGSLPMAASDYLRGDPSRRVLALRASSDTTIRYAMMRTAAGDLIDVAPSVDALRIAGEARPEDAQLTQLCARLLSSNSDEAIRALAALGVGGIWIPDAGDDVQRTLLTHVTASNGTQTVVDNDRGAYVRLVSDAAQGVGIDVSGERAALDDPLRRAWVAAGIAVFVSYLLVALPRRSDLSRRERP